jgi:hypothetical protein
MGRVNDLLDGTGGKPSSRGTPRALVAWPAMDAPAASGQAPGAGAFLFVGLVGAIVLGAAFAGDGSDVGGTLPVGGAAVVLLAGVLAVAAFGVLPFPRIGRSGGALVATAIALVLWTGLTVVWSIVPDRSWDVFNRGVAFLAFLGLGVMLAGMAGRLAARLTASLLAIALGAVLAWALLSKVVPSLGPEGDRVARLREPVGYWNALALFADVAIALGLWLATAHGRLAVRIGGGLLVYAATLALLLTLSRAGVVAAAVVVVLWLVLSRERLESALVLCAAVVPALLVGAWAFTRPALVEDVALRSDREADGAVLGVFLLLGAGVVAVFVVLGSRRSLAGDARRRVGRGLAVAGAIAGLAAAILLLAGAAGAVSQGRDCAEVANEPGRFGSFESARLCWWGEAWDVFSGHAPEGAGAGSFEVARKRYRLDARNVLQPHSVPLQQLADGGVVALALFLALVSAGTAVCVCALRRTGADERPAAIALVAAPVAYLLHALVDYSWDFLAVTAPTMLALGVLAGVGREAGPLARRPLLGVGAVVAALVVLVSFAAPRLAESAVRGSTEALDAGDVDRARARAERGMTWNPLSTEPILALARIEERSRDLPAAARRYREAVDLQPENPETLYALGLFELEARKRMCDAYRYLNDAWTLDPAGNQWVPGGPLDVARDAVDAGACERQT